MKILWLSNSILGNKNIKATGTWLQTMSLALLKKGVSLYNITQDATVQVTSYFEEDNLFQWVLPVAKTNKKGLPDKTVVDEIRGIVRKVNPDIIHIWGTEFYWGLLPSDVFQGKPVLLEMEGIVKSCAEVYYGGLTPSELLSCIRLKEILSFKRSIFGNKRMFSKWGERELRLLGRYDRIATQSDWVRTWIAPYTCGAKIYRSIIPIRQEFYDNKWRMDKSLPYKVITISSGPDPYKGVHNAIKAISIVKKSYPQVQLYIIGNFGDELPVYRKPGYTKFLQKMIVTYGLQNNVLFTGALTADQIVKEMSNARVFLHCSFVESYSLSTAEAMAFGIPTVLPYSGAIPELSSNQSSLFYSAVDYHQCGGNICRLFDSPEMSLLLSKEAIKVSSNRNSCERAVLNQIDIYKNMLKERV